MLGAQLATVKLSLPNMFINHFSKQSVRASGTHHISHWTGLPQAACADLRTCIRICCKPRSNIACLLSAFRSTFEPLRVHGRQQSSTGQSQIADLCSWGLPRHVPEVPEVRMMRTAESCADGSYLFGSLKSRSPRALDTARPVAGRPLRGGEITRQQLAKSTKPPCLVIRALPCTSP